MDKKENKTDMSILHLDAIAQADLIKKGEITPLELVDLSIAAIEKHNPTLNAVITPMFEQAREQAKKDLPDAPFKGVPIVLKDGVASYKGVRMTSGSALFKNYIGRFDSTLVTRLKKAGFIVVGKTNMPEFGLLPVTEPTAFGACRNPYDTNLTPGGSSGGTASAVAARMVALGHGNDGGGSIRIPASCCGLFGLKPTRGRNPLGPNFSELVGGLVAEHVLTRSVRDSAAVLDLTAGPEIDSIYYAPPKTVSYLEAIKESPRSLKIGYSLTTPNGGEVHQDCIDATLHAVELCKALGHEVVPKQLKMPFSGKQLGNIFSTTWAVGATSAVAYTKKMTGQLPPRESLEPLTWALYEASQKISASDYEMARNGMHAIARSVLRSFSDIDVWLSPTLGQPPVPVGAMAQNPENPMAPMMMSSKFAPMTAIFNISGQPAASLPTYRNEAGMPIGVQIVGKFGDEATLFQLAAQLEKEVNWEQYVPNL